ncbi:MAG: NAD(P)H-hydrate dehydratase [Actinomycetales bacterium]
MLRRKLNKTDNKYSRGVVAVAAGSNKFPGAAILTVGGARRGNAGYVKFLTSSSRLTDLVIAKFPDCVPIASLKNERVDVLVAGSGGSKVNTIPRDIPVVLDGEMIKFVKNKDFKKRSAYSVITPHEGELRFLDKKYSEQIKKLARREIAEDIANKYGVIVVLKGNQTIIAGPGKSKVDSIGGAELATAGSGDVLAGLIGSILASNSADPFELVCNAVELHSRAGRYAAAKFKSVSALEIMDSLAFV